MLAGVCLVLTACSADGTVAPVPAPITAAAEFHVDCGGTKPGDGTSASPWTSLDQVTAHGRFEAGEKILLRRGSVCHGRLTPAGSGANGRPITVGAYGIGPLPLIAGDGTPDRTGAVQLTDQHDWVLSEIAVTNRDPAGPGQTARSGILVVNDGAGRLANIVVRGTDVRDVTSNPGVYEAGGIAVLQLGTTPDDAFENVLVDGNRVTDVGRVGIVIWSGGWPNASIRTAAVLRNRVLRAQGDSILLYGVVGGVIEHNVSRDGGRLPACPACTSPVRTQVAGIWPTRSRDIAVRYNEVSGENASGGDGEGFDVDIDTAGVVLEGNLAHDNDGGGLLLCGTSGAAIASNVFANDLGAEISFSCTDPPSGIRIVGNTFAVQSGVPVVRVVPVAGTSTDPLLFANNIVVNPGDGTATWPVPVESVGNTVLGSVPDPSAPALEAPFAGLDGLDSAAAYRPRDPAAAVGAVVAGGATTDYFGTLLTAPIRGAVAASGAPVAPARPAPPAVTGIPEGVHLEWAAAPGALTRIDRAGPDGLWATVVAAAVGTTWDDHLPPAGALRYRVVSIGRAGAGPVSAAAAWRRPSAAPTR